MKTNTLRELGYAKEDSMVDRSFKHDRFKRVDEERPIKLSRMTVDELKEAWDREPKGEYADEILRRLRR